MELLIPLKSQSEIPMYEQIYNYIKEEIRNGRLEAAVKIPSTRVLAEHLKVSRSTTQMAYEQLMSEGYIEAVPCKGYYVAETAGLVNAGHSGMAADWTKRASAPFLDVGDLQGEPSPSPVQDLKYKVDFSPRGIDLGSFPFNVWRKITRNTLVDDNKAMFAAGDPQGEPALREAIGNYLHSARGVNCGPDQIVVGAGSEYLLLLLYQILGRNRLIAMENPTYKQAYRVFERLGYQVVPVGMDRYGLDAGLLKESGADTAYVMPSHQYPMGIVMPVKRRQELLSWALEQEGRYLIEDDYDSEFRYKGKPIPALQGMDRQERVIYLGTFSKSIAPAIRVSYMVLPRKLLAVYKEKYNFYASTVSRIDQNIIYQFIVEGHYERHLNRMRAVYKGKHDTFLAALKPLESAFLVQGEYAGLHLLLTHKGGLSEKMLIKSAGNAGVRVYGLSSYYINPGNRGPYATVVMGYANLSEEEIKQGVELLIQAWFTDRDKGETEEIEEDRNERI